MAVSKAKADKITTDRQVAALKPKATIYETAIAGVRGFQIRTFPSGTKAFELRYTATNGARRRLPLGEYPNVSLADASKKAAAARVKVVDGADPAGERQAEKTRARTGETLDELAEAYWAAAAKGLHGGRGRPKAASTLNVEKPRYANHISPKLGTRRFADLTRSDVKAFMRELASGDRAADTVASIGRLLSAILSFAVHEERIEANPAMGLTQPLALKPRDRLFPDASLKALWKPLSAVPTFEPVEQPKGKGEPETSAAVAMALRLALLTLTRRADVAGARWEEVDWKARTWTVPGVRHKSRKPHVVPLGPEALALIRTAAQITDGPKASAEKLQAGYIFPSPLDRKRHITERAMTRALARMCEDAKIPPGSPHDFRRTGATHMTGEQLGIRRFVVSKVLGHAAHEGAAVTAVYDRNEYLPEKRKALEAWEGLLLEIVGERGRAGNVVSILGAA
jgi:integrase